MTRGPSTCTTRRLGGLLRQLRHLAGSQLPQDSRCPRRCRSARGTSYLAVGHLRSPPRAARLLDPHTLAATGPGPGNARRRQPNPRDRPRLQRERQVPRGGDSSAHLVRGQEFGPEGRSSVVVWDLRHPLDRPPDVMRTEAILQGMVLSPDGRTVYTILPADCVRRGDWSGSVVDGARLLVGARRQSRRQAARLRDSRTTRRALASKSGPIRLTDALYRRDASGSCAATRTSPSTFASRPRRPATRLRLPGRRAHRVERRERARRSSAPTRPRRRSACPSAPTSTVSTRAGTPANSLRTWDLYGDQQFLRRTVALPGCAELRPRSTRHPTHAVGLFHVAVKSETSILFPRHCHGEEGLSARLHGLDLWECRGRQGRGIPMVGGMPSTTSLRHDHRAGCPDRAAASVADPGSTQRLIYSMDYVDKGERLIVGDDRAA